MQIWGSLKSQYQISGQFCLKLIVKSLYRVVSHMDTQCWLEFSALTMISCYSFYDRSSPIYTQPRYLPPSKMLDADVTDSVIGEGCVIKVGSFEARSALNLHQLLSFLIPLFYRVLPWNTYHEVFRNAFPKFLVSVFEVFLQDLALLLQTIDR